LTFTVFGKKNPTPIRYDSSKIELRTSPQIEKYKTDKDFVYEDNAAVPITFFQKILNYILRFIETIFSDTGVAPYIRYFVYFLIFIFVIYLLFRMNFGSVFFWGKKSARNADLEIYEEDVLNTNYDILIQDALNSKNYRAAVRYLYLKLLKNLALSEIIRWEPDKTNRDYRNEMKSHKFSAVFETLTHDYEYVWYGNFQINPDIFSRVNEEFKAVFVKLNV
jgi:hypothetical protein